jgi:hypothetical protein
MVRKVEKYQFISLDFISSKERSSLQSGIFLHTKHIGPRCRPPVRQPTTTTVHHTTCRNLQSYAPDDGQMFARNMLS